MPNVKNQVFRIKIIDELLSRKSWVKTSTIRKVIEDNMMEPVSDRTIQNDIIAMRDDTRLGYYAPIEYNNSKKAYMYSEPGYSINNFSLTSEEIDALQFYAGCMQVFSGYKLFDTYTRGIRKVIQGVKMKNHIRPNVQPETIVQTDSIACVQGEEYIEDLVYAISNKREIRLTYLAYHQSKAYERRLLPMLLKEYRNRWYLLAYKFSEKKIKTYGLDRVKKLKVTDDTLREEIDFDPLYYFKHSFGITTPDVPVKEVVLRFSKTEAPYVKSLPIHPTQKIIEETDKFLTVAITVTLSYELYEYILSKSPDVKVLGPAEVISEIARKAAETKKNYE